MSAQRETKIIQIELSTWIYDALAAKARELGESESAIAEEGLKLLLGLDASSATPAPDASSDSSIERRFVAFERQMRKLVDSLIDRRIELLTAQLLGNSEAIATESEKLIPLANASASKQGIPISAAGNHDTAPSVRQLRVGDLVQIRDPDSVNYLETVVITKVGTIRATVATDTGEQSFLKRDLRFVRSESAPGS